MDRAGNGIVLERVEQVGSATDVTIAREEEPDKHRMSLRHTLCHIGAEKSACRGALAPCIGTWTAGRTDERSERVGQPLPARFTPE